MMYTLRYCRYVVIESVVRVLILTFVVSPHVRSLDPVDMYPLFCFGLVDLISFKMLIGDHGAFVAEEEKPF